MNIFKSLALVLLIFLSCGSSADIIEKIGIIKEIQMESATRSGYEDIIYVTLIGDWSKPTDCAYGYYKASENPHFTSLFLAAKFAKEEVRIAIETNLPKVGSNCQIINTYIRDE